MQRCASNYAVEQLNFIRSLPTQCRVQKTRRLALFEFEKVSRTLQRVGGRLALGQDSLKGTDGKFPVDFAARLRL